MKKIILSATMLTVLVLASCGKSAVCDCAETGLSMMKEAQEAKMDPAKMTAIQEKYKGDIEKCEKLDAGKTYHVKGYGIRFPFLGMYHKIYDIGM